MTSFFKYYSSIWIAIIFSIFRANLNRIEISIFSSLLFLILFLQVKIFCP